MRKWITLLMALCLMAVPVLSTAEATPVDLASMGFSVMLPAGMQVVRDEMNADTGVGVVVIAASEDAPVQYTFRTAPLPEGQDGDLAAMDDAGRAAFATAVLGEYADAEVIATQSPSGASNAVQLTADGGKLFAYILSSDGQSLSCRAYSEGDALTDADKEMLNTLLASANG